VSIYTSLKDQIATLVHPSARDYAIERARHETFILGHLTAGVVVLALLPVFIALEGPPSAGEALGFGWMLLPLVAIVIVSRTGSLLVAQSICVGAVLALGATVGVIDGPGSLAAVAWLVLAPLEALLSLNRVLILVSGLGAATTAMAGIFGARMGLLPQADMGVHASLFVIPAIAYATSLSWAAARLQELRRRMAHAGAASYRILAEVIGDVVLRHDRSGAVLYASASCESMIGLPPRELHGRAFFERIHVADRPIFLKAIADAADSKETVSAMFRLRTGSAPSAYGDFDEPRFSWVELRARHSDHDANIDDDGCTVVSVLRDMTQARRHEEEIEAARAAAERANLWKDRFLANVSHELRTPLNAIIGFSEMLGNPELAPKDPARQREYAGIIRESGTHLLEVVNSALDISKIEAGSFDLTPEPFAMPPLVDLCCDIVRLKAAEGGVELVRAYPENLDEIVADKRACKQMLINLLSNAVKFTPRDGRVVVSVRPDGNAVLINVTDTGIGILAADMERLGDPFFQARATYDRPYEGTGLGLSIVRGLVALHGGSVAVESSPGEGTSVTVRLPLDCRVARPSSGKIEVLSRRDRPAAQRIEFPADAMVKKIA
jgi:cell cycle sensor histidine kinase DivJ